MISTAAAIAATFNLLCTGTSTTTTLQGKKTEPYEATYRLDLDKMKWCESECKALHDIAKVQPTFISLQDEKEDTPSRQSMTISQVDRETGRHTATLTAKTYGRFGYTVIITYDGQCERQPFSGFPKFETKF